MNKNSDDIVLKMGRLNELNSLINRFAQSNADNPLTHREAIEFANLSLMDQCYVCLASNKVEVLCTLNKITVIEAFLELDDFYQYELFHRYGPKNGAN